MKKVLLFVVAIIAINNLFAQSEWVRFKMDDRVSVLMPTTPKKGESENPEMYSLISKDSSSFTLMKLDFESYGLDSAALTAQVETEAFKDQFTNGFMQELEDSKMDSFTVGKLGNYVTYNLAVNYKSKTGDTAKTFTYCVFVGSKLYGFIYASAAAMQEDKQKFFDSVKID